MANRDYIEKALLLGMARNQSWMTMIKNSMDKKYFSPANYKLYQYIEECASKNEYPELKTISAKFGFDDQTLAELLDYTDYNNACTFLKDEYTIAYLNYAVGELNEHQNEMVDNPS